MTFSEAVSLFEMEDYQHTPLNHDQLSIRLVQVLPQLSADGLLQCEIIQYVLPSTVATEDDRDFLANMEDDNERCEPYICLSYVWGDSQDQYPIKVNGKLVHVRKNLGDFLSHARETLFHTYMWIDALCIDQSNTKERNHQVQRMGSIYAKAQMVLIWLGNDSDIENVLRSVNVASGIHRSDYLQQEWEKQALHWKHRPMLDYHGSIMDLSQSNVGKVLDLIRKLSENCYWSRAWITQEVLLANHAMVAAGEEAHGLLSLASKLRTQEPYSRDSAFEQIIDICMHRKSDSFMNQRMRWHDNGTFLQDWGIINLLQYFRNKMCAVRRDRIYSLLALCDEGKGFDVDYDVPEQQVMQQVLNIRKDSICLCSTAIVGHALAPWEIPPMEKTAVEAPFAELHMYAAALTSTVCPFCANWVPFSWTRRTGLVFCLASACSDTQGHMFLEQLNNTANSYTGGARSSKAQSFSSIYLQQRQNNKSLLLCENNNGLRITQSKWRHVHHLRFTFRTLLAVLDDDMETGGLGLNNCGHLWPGDSKSRLSDNMRLRLCDDARVHVE